MSIEKKLEAATKVHEQALQALTAARESYEKGAGKAYADALQTEADLKQRLEAYREEASQAEAKFKELMAKANYTVTKEVRAALNAKNDAIAIAEEIGGALQRHELERTRILLEEAAPAAREYYSAYQAASRAAVEFHTYTALAVAGKEIAKVMAMVPYIGSYQDRDTFERLFDLDELQRSLVMRELTEMAKGFDGREYRQALGGFNLAPLKLSELPSPIQTNQMLRKLEAAAAGT